MKSLLLFFASFARASHLDDIPALDNFKFDTVYFKTKKDCSLDAHPAVSIILFILLILDETIT